jgi:hypothetical protein
MLPTSSPRQDATSILSLPVQFSGELATTDVYCTCFPCCGLDQGTGQLHVIFERCLLELLKFIGLYFLADIGFTLAFYTLLNGTTSVVPGGTSGDPATNLSQFEVPYPFSSIGYGMVQVIRWGG